MNEKIKEQKMQASKQAVKQWRQGQRRQQESNDELITALISWLHYQWVVIISTEWMGFLKIFN